MRPSCWICRRCSSVLTHALSIPLPTVIASVFAALSYGVDVTTTETVHFPNKTHAKVTDTVTYKLGTAPKVLFAGCSAGSRGAMFNLDYVQDMLPPGAPPVLGFFDSPMCVLLHATACEMLAAERSRALAGGLTCSPSSLARCR